MQFTRMETEMLCQLSVGKSGIQCTINALCRPTFICIVDIGLKEKASRDVKHNPTLQNQYLEL
jgi:hypothetical protein